MLLLALKEGTKPITDASGIILVHCALNGLSKIILAGFRLCHLRAPLEYAAVSRHERSMQPHIQQ
jgi:hypothetical protein